jgi:hypothetical protein
MRVAMVSLLLQGARHPRIDLALAQQSPQSCLSRRPDGVSVVMTDSDMRELVYLARRDAGARLSRCIGKDRFESRLSAQSAIRGRVKLAGAHPYRCMYCAQYHVGTTIVPRVLNRGRGNDAKNASHGGHA